jgi:hypothetical protein
MRAEVNQSKGAEEILSVPFPSSDGSIGEGTTLSQIYEEATGPFGSQAGVTSLHYLLLVLLGVLAHKLSKVRTRTEDRGRLESRNLGSHV